jgi:hypothetical protein
MVQVYIWSGERAVDLPELGPAILHLAENSPCPIQLVYVRGFRFPDCFRPLHFHLGPQCKSAGPGRPVECLHLRGQLAVLVF